MHVSSLPDTSPAKSSPAAIIDRLLNDTFAPSLGRLERSSEYIAGVRALLLQQLIGKPLACAYAAGTSAADAFFAGVDEGRTIHAKYLSTVGRAECYSDPYAGLKGHDYIKARNLAPLVQKRVQTSAQSEVTK